MMIDEQKLALEKLAKIQPGDIVAINDYSRGWGNVDKMFPQRIRLMKVERLTPTQAVTTDGRRFRITDGRVVGNGYSFHRIFVPSPAEIAEAQETMRVRKLAAWFDKLELKDVSVAQLRAMKDAYDAVTPAAPTEGAPA